MRGVVLAILIVLVVLLARTEGVLGSEERIQVVDGDVTDLVNTDSAPVATDESGPSNDDEAPGRREFVLAIDQLYIEGNTTAAAALLHQSVVRGYAFAYPLLAMCYQYGIGVPQSDAKAVLYYTFGAHAGNIDATLAMAYRHQQGIGVPKSCDAAVRYARAAADRVAKTYSSDVHPMVEYVKLSDLSLASTATKEASVAEMLQFHEFRADKGAVNSLMVLGYAHMLGRGGRAQDGHRAVRLFEQAADGGEAAGHGALGQVYAQGIASATPPIPRDPAKALEHFQRGAEANHPVSLNGLGFMYARGEGVEQSFAEAAKHFQASAAQGNAEGLYNLGVLHLNGKGVQKDVRRAVELLARAAASGSVLAHWQLGALNLQGIGGFDVSCQAALRHYKAVLERAPWNRRVMTAAEEYLDGDTVAALFDYLQAAETGIGVARINAAFILERNQGLEALEFHGSPLRRQQRPKKEGVDETIIDDAEDAATDTRLAILHQLILRAAQEGDTDAHLKLGDHYYYGVGTAVDFAKAEEHYAIAAAMNNAQALFNLGYMREHGIGSSPRDFHLAKRYYDSAAEASAAAHYVVQAALIKLNFHWWLAWYAEQPGGVWGALVPSFAGVPLDDVLLAFFTVVAVALLLLRNHAIAMGNRQAGN